MAKTSNNTPLEICGRLVKPGEQLSFGLEVPDLYVNTGLAIPVSVIRGKRDGPALLLCAAIHGNEINGVEIIRRLRTLRALAFMTVLPSVTCPSPPMTTCLPRRTEQMVVPR